MIKQIRRVSIIGMGALGIMYGYFLSKSLKDIKLTFVADRERLNSLFSPSRARPSTKP